MPILLQKSAISVASRLPRFSETAFYFPLGSGNASGTITDEMINEYINEQEGEAVQDDSRFEIDPS
ncbi:MAG: hypothetical protein WAU53_18605 [Rhodoplanes sp.]